MHLYPLDYWWRLAQTLDWLLKEAEAEVIWDLPESTRGPNLADSNLNLAHEMSHNHCRITYIRRRWSRKRSSMSPLIAAIWLAWTSAVCTPPQFTLWSSSWLVRTGELNLYSQLWCFSLSGAALMSLSLKTPSDKGCSQGWDYGFSWEYNHWTGLVPTTCENEP